MNGKDTHIRGIKVFSPKTDDDGKNDEMVEGTGLNGLMERDKLRKKVKNTKTGDRATRVEKSEIWDEDKARKKVSDIFEEDADKKMAVDSDDEESEEDGDGDEDEDEREGGLRGFSGLLPLVSDGLGRKGFGLR